MFTKCLHEYGSQQQKQMIFSYNNNNIVNNGQQCLWRQLGNSLPNPFIQLSLQ